MQIKVWLHYLWSTMQTLHRRCINISPPPPIDLWCILPCST